LLQSGLDKVQFNSSKNPASVLSSTLQILLLNKQATNVRVSAAVSADAFQISKPQAIPIRSAAVWKNSKFRMYN
jgi:hypothetical protein